MTDWLIFFFCYLFFVLNISIFCVVNKSEAFLKEIVVCDGLIIRLLKAVVPSYSLYCIL